ncbi:hypothetical protein EDD18DRAFT_1158122 [Armillaria luteobubalina]|uniref:Uncharacterized protein n=1 Tax=Armillaria luteobubalina TaxID=153913 RepID=A0AA39QA24_9AGAR|nr:hypothetical protein EDD18DRAFT_1158122 [Armillaria luteobubalina]
MPSTIRTVIQDDKNHLFLCLESDALPPVPTKGTTFEDSKDSKDSWLPDPEDFLGRSWASDTRPYQGFLPIHRSSVYQCDLFKCLDYSSPSIPLFSPSPGQWALETKVADQWKHLEYLLVLLRQTLGRKFDCIERLPYPRFPLPWEYGYHHAKCHKMAMEDAAIRSRDAFLILAGEISFLMALAIAKNEGNDWEIMLTEEVGGNWTDLIRTSWLVQKDSGFWQRESEASRRVGLFVDPRVCKNAAIFLEAYTAYAVPVWIDWGPITSPFDALDSSLYQRLNFWPSTFVRRTTTEHPASQMRDVLPGPTRQQASEIFVGSESEDSEQNVPQHTTRLSDVLAASCSNGTRITIEGQKRSEETQILHTPTCEEQGSYGQNAGLDPDGQQCSTGGVGVFVCEKVDDKEFVTARRRASGCDIPPWLEHPPLRRGRSLQASVVKLSAPSLINSKPCSAEAWEKAYTKLFDVQLQVLGEGLKPKEYEYWSLKDVLHFRFGIQIARPLDQTPKLTVVDEAKVKNCLKSLEHFSVRQDDVEKSTLLSLEGFVSWLAWHAAKKKDNGNSAIIVTASHVQPPPTPGIPVAWWDLSPQSHSYLGKHHTTSLDIQAVRWHNGKDERTGYRLQVQGASKVLDQRYMLIVYRADDVLHCLRLSGVTGPDDLIQELCGHGVRFTVGIQAGPPDPKSLGKPCANGQCQDILIPCRPANFKATLADYMSYVRRRAALLRDPVVASAALMHGGIIWRLAMEHIDDFSVVLRRLATDDILRYGKCHKVTVLGREKHEIHMYEASLSESQMDVICGVYKVYNRSSNGYTLTQDISWFPKDDSFKKSALNVGFWTADTEQWYTRRVDMYLSGDSEKSCLNQAGWRSSARLWRCAIATYKGLETVSRHFVDRLLARQ